ncbi:MAG: NAD(P)-dependent dehydrogenase (short-subunit alcohol dehydrogenase family) [Gammaproteobacteria bacterium]|jgi:NAD(P)-dependent dehydrogenase (short-subunit alcohol dehydrogenase family)
MDLELTGKVAVVTGGSRGIGEAIAARFIAEGAKVIIAARRPDMLAAAVAKLGPDATPIEADVTVLDDLDRIATLVKKQFGRCDVLVNNAGTGTYKPFLEVTDQELMDGMAINFFAQFRLTQRLVPMMIEQREGVVINISGRTALQTAYPPGSTCTGPAKAAEVRFTTDLADELKPHGVRVLGIIPGVVMTPDRFAKWETEARGRDLTEQEAASLRDRLEEDRLPTGARWGTPEQIADLTVFLASTRASYVSGTSVLADGSPGAYSYVRALNETP